MNQKYFIVDLFSGCGGSAKGFQKAGFSIKAGVEINETASKSFSKNFPKAVQFGDIRDVSGEEIMLKAKISDADRIVILACPPCQGFSSARRVDQRRKDKRNKLIDHFVRLVDEIRPVAFVMENVPGLAGPVGKDYLNKARRKLKKAGYYIPICEVLRTEDYGVPQKRRRLVMIGTRLKDVKLSLPKITHGPNLKRYVSVRDKIGKLPKIEAGEQSKNDELHISANLKPVNIDRLKHTKPNGGTRADWPDYLQLDCHKRTKGHTDTYARMKWDEPSPTITGGCTNITKGRFAHPEQNRGISLREAALLQSFPPNFIFFGHNGEKADQIGNAVPVLFARKIAKELLTSLQAR